MTDGPPRVLSALFDLHEVRGFFDRPTCERLIAELAFAPSAPAPVYGLGDAGVVNDRVRSVARLRPSPGTITFVASKLMEARATLSERFGLELHDIEEPQFLRYSEGGFFVAHQDGGTGMLRSHSEQTRKMSVVIFLNSQSGLDEAGTFGGGSLVFTEWRADRPTGRFELNAKAGSLISFLPDTTHEVTPVTRGERYSIACWYL